MKTFIDQVMNRFSERERLLLLLVGLPCLVVLLYFLLWRPFDQDVERLQQRVLEQQALSQWMQAAAQQVKQLQRQAEPRGNRSRQSLLARVDQTIRQAGLSKALKRVEPDGATKVKVRLEQASFDAVTRWLETLQQRHAVTVQSINVDRQDSVGIVNVRLTLVGGGK